MSSEKGAASSAPGPDGCASSSRPMPPWLGPIAALVATHQGRHPIACEATPHCETRHTRVDRHLDRGRRLGNDRDRRGDPVCDNGVMGDLSR